MDLCVHGINRKYCGKCKDTAKPTTCKICKQPTNRTVRSIASRYGITSCRNGWYLCSEKCDKELAKQVSLLTAKEVSGRCVVCKKLTSNKSKNGIKICSPECEVEYEKRKITPHKVDGGS